MEFRRLLAALESGMKHAYVWGGTESCRNVAERCRVDDATRIVLRAYIIHGVNAFSVPSSPLLSLSIGTKIMLPLVLCAWRE